jgi:hypothetical protein
MMSSAVCIGKIGGADILHRDQQLARLRRAGRRRQLRIERTDCQHIAIRTRSIG